MSSGFRQENVKNSSARGARPDPPGGSPWELGDWTVQPSSHELVHRSGRRVRLEARTMRVLLVLHAGEGEVVTTEALLDRVWEGKVVSQHSVSTVISELRKILAVDPKLTRIIETIPKRGYRLNAARDAAPPLAGESPWARRRVVSLALGAVATLALIVGVLWIRGVDSFGLTGSRAVESTRTAQFVRARQLWSLREHDATLEARRLLTDLIADDDTFAPAHAALADIYAHKTGNELDLSELDTFREAQRLLDRARSLDPDLPESFVTQAVLDFYRDNQPLKALAAVDEALARDNEFASAWQTRAMLLSVLGRHEESLTAIARARELDPASNSIGWDEVWFLYLARQPERAHQAFERVSMRSPPYYLFGALIEQQRGNARGALEHWLMRLKDRGAQLPDRERIETLIAAESSQAAYAELLRQVRSIEGYRESSVVLATWQLLSGDEAGARQMLANATPERSNWLTFWIPEMPVLAPLRNLPAQRGEI